MQDKLETRWTHEDTLKAYNPYREMFREASAEVVKDIFGQHIRPQDRIIEIGSGLGELVTLAPEYRDQIQQTEQSPKIAEGNRTLHLDSNVKVANVYDLPFQDGEFNLAVGYSVFDTLANLEDALTEVGRVLTPTGKFIHFLDLQACGNTLHFKYQDSDFIGFPAIDEIGYSVGVRLVPKSETGKLVDKVDPRKKQLFDIYINQPEVGHELIDNPQYRHILMDMAQEIQKHYPDAQVIRFNEFFFGNLESALKQSGYKIIESGKRDGIAVVQRNGRHAKRPNINLYHNDVGFDLSKYDSDIVRELKPEQVKVISTHYVTVAQKAQPK